MCILKSAYALYMSMGYHYVCTQGGGATATPFKATKGLYMALIFGYKIVQLLLYKCNEWRSPEIAPRSVGANDAVKS